MSKITFRADDDLVERLEACDASKSEVMRDALRAYLDATDDEPASDVSDDGIDAAIAERIDELIQDRLDAAIDDRFGGPADGRPETIPGVYPTHGANVGHAPHTASPSGELTVNVTVDGAGVGDAAASVGADAAATPDGTARAPDTPDRGRSGSDATPTDASDDDGTSDGPGTTRDPSTAYDDAGERKTPATPPTGRPENVCGGCGESVPEEHVYCPNCGEKQSHRAFCECGDEVRTDWAFCPGCGRRTPAADVLNDR